MNLKSRKARIAGLLALAIFAAMLIFLACSKEDDKPEIVGCNSVKYKGYTYTNLGCARGIVSFDVTTTQDGHTASFHITCSNGCISSATVVGGKSIAAPTAF